MAQAIIEAGTIDFTPFSLSSDKAIWRKEDLTIPPMYRPTIALTRRPNRTGTNVNMAIKLVRPITSIVNGVTVSSNSRVLSVSYTALQNVTDTNAEADIDVLIAFLTAYKAKIVQAQID